MHLVRPRRYHQDGDASSSGGWAPITALQDLYVDRLIFSKVDDTLTQTQAASFRLMDAKAIPQPVATNFVPNRAVIQGGGLCLSREYR